MPRTKLDKPKAPPIDRLKACFLERKQALNLTWPEIAEGSHVSEGHLRHLMTYKHTDDWSPDVRRAVCRKLGIVVKMKIELLEDEEGWERK